MQIDFSAAIDRTNHLGVLYRIRSVLNILTQCLLNRSQHDMVDGCRRKLVNVVSRLPQDSVLVRLLFLLYTSELFSMNKLFGYADDSTLLSVVPSPELELQ